jgi:hypothetical protein
VLKRLGGEARDVRKFAIVALAPIAMTMFAVPVKGATWFQVQYLCQRNNQTHIWGAAGCGYLFDKRDAFTEDHFYYTMVGVSEWNLDTFIEAGPCYYVDPYEIWFGFFVTYKDHGGAVMVTFPETYDPGDWATVTICKDKYDPSGINWHVFMSSPHHYIMHEVNFWNSGQWEGDFAMSTVESGEGIVNYSANENELVSIWDSLSYLTPGAFGNWEYWGMPGYSRAWFGPTIGGNTWLGTVKDPDAPYGYGSSWYSYIPNIDDYETR